MYTNTRFQLIGTASNFGTKFFQKCMTGKTSQKINIKIVNKHIVMYPYTKFQSICRTSDFEIKFAQKI